MVYRVCEMLGAVLKQPNLEPPWRRAYDHHGAPLNTDNRDTVMQWQCT